MEGDLAVAEGLVDSEAAEEVEEAVVSSPEEEGVGEDSEGTEGHQGGDHSEEGEELGEISREEEEGKAAPNLIQQTNITFFHYHQLASYFQHMLL